MSSRIADNELNKLFCIAKLNEQCAYGNISTSSITLRLRVLLLPTVLPPINEVLAWAGLAPAEEGLRRGSMYGGESMLVAPFISTLLQ